MAPLLSKHYGNGVTLREQNYVKNMVSTPCQSYPAQGNKVSSRVKMKPVLRLCLIDAKGYLKLKIDDQLLF